MKKEFRPLIIQDTRGNKNLINCHEIVDIVKIEEKGKYYYCVDLTSGVGILVSLRIGEILLDWLTDELFYTPESIEMTKAILE